MNPAVASVDFASAAFQEIVENSPFAIFVNQDRRFVYVNPATVALYRAESADDLLGRCPLDFVDPDYQDTVVARIERVNGGQATPKMRQRIVAFDGTMIDVEVTASPIRFHGRPAGSVVLRDITDSIEVERHLETTEERFRLVSQATTDVVWDLDVATGSVWCSRPPADFFGHERAEISTLDGWIRQIHHEDRLRVLQSFQLAVASSEVLWSDSYRLVHPDGTFVHIVDRAYIVRDRSGCAVRVVGSMTDVSELLRAREESATLTKLLEQANRIAGLGRLSATVAHEFNNVLMSIQPHAEIIARKSTDPAAVTRSSQAIMQGIKRGKQITEEILRFARPIEPALTPLALGDWLERFAQDVRAVNMPNIDFVLEMSLRDAYVLADARQLEQILWNLVINARDAMPQGGKLSITSGVCTDCKTQCDILPPDDLAPFTCIQVTDTGQGIPEELLQKIFEPLFTTKKNGTGLGLAVVHQIVTRHRGYIFAKSRVGVGTSFYVLLRTAAKADASAT